MNGRKADWSWPVFFAKFWGAFGKMIAAFLVLYLLAAVFADTSYATFESAIFGIAFALIASVIYGWSAGDEAIRKWREE